MEQFSHSETRAIAQAEMSKWGLTDRGWKFVIDNAKTRNGQCSYTKKTISLTTGRIDHDSKEDVVHTIRHEIAHVLHYFEYVDAGRKSEFFARKRQYTRRMQVRLVRIVKPHGEEWKRIARKVGVDNPSYASKSNAPVATMQKWRVVIVTSHEVDDAGYGRGRFVKQMSLRAIRGRRDTKGKLHLVNGQDWKAYTDGRKSLNQLQFFQDCPYQPAIRRGALGF
jgi:predicted SprT family Zn-dependent metalloprotease